MGEAKQVEEAPKIDPLRTTSFGLAEHSYRRFSATVATLDDVENPDFWVHVAPQFRIGDEVRLLAEDMSFVATGLCTYASGRILKIKIIEKHELDVVNEDDIVGADRFYIKMRGPLKWCIVDSETNENIKTHIADQVTAARELSDYKKALGI